MAALSFSFFFSLRRFFIFTIPTSLLHASFLPLLAAVSQVLERLMVRGALAAYLDVLESVSASSATASDAEDNAEARLYRAALWGITTWLGTCSLEQKATFIRQKGLAALLEVRRAKQVAVHRA